MDDTEDWLRTLGDKYDRVWVLKSGTHPYFDEEWHLEKWLPDNMLRVRDAKFFSHSSLHAFLFLPKIPVFEQLPADVQHPLTAEYGNLVRLAGYSLDPVADEKLPAQVRLYWQVLEKPQRRYKYIVQLVEQAPDGSTQVLSSLEREPYEGDIPTLYWDPGKTILEYVEFPVPAAAAGRRQPTLPYVPDVRRRNAGKAAGDQGCGWCRADGRHDCEAALMSAPATVLPGSSDRRAQRAGPVQASRRCSDAAAWAAGIIILIFLVLWLCLQPGRAAF